MKDQQKVNATLVDALGSALRSGDHGLKTVPGLLKRVLSEESWREFTTQRGELVRYDRLEDFIVRPPLKGLGASVDLVRRVVSRDPEAVDLLDQALQEGHGGDRRSPQFKGGNHSLDTRAPVIQKRDRTSQHLRRLRKDFPGLHADVLAERLTVHEAAVKAGIQPRRLSINLLDPASALRSVRENSTPAFWAEFKRLAGE